MTRIIIICLLAAGISTAANAQFFKKKKKTPDTEQTDSTALKKDSTVNQKISSDTNADVKKDSPKFDYKKANKKAVDQEKSDAAPLNNNNADQPASTQESDSKPESESNNESGSKSESRKESSGSKSKSNTNERSGSKSNSKNVRSAPPQRAKYVSPSEKKKEEEREAEIEATTPHGVEALYYQLPLEDLPVVQEFMDFKQAESPHVRIKDDKTLRKQIIRFKDVQKGYMMLQKPGETKYTRLQAFKKANGNFILAVEQSDCPNGICSGTLKFYIKTAGGWKDTTDEYYPQLDYKYVIDRLRSAYKKEYKDLELYDTYGYEDNDANLKKAIIYQISPDDGTIIIEEQNLPCKLYTMVWDPKKEKFDLKKDETSILPFHK